MRYEWNPTKRASNLAKHGIDFLAVEDFEWDTALIEADVRQFYGEVRLVAYGRIKGRLHALVYTIRRTSTWVISLRRANNKEVRHYESEG